MVCILIANNLISQEETAEINPTIVNVEGIYGLGGIYDHKATNGGVVESAWS